MASTNEVQSADQEPASHATAFFSEPPDIARVAQTLAAHGGGALSVDLAFDLILNQAVEQAREVTGATGAAIALFRDGTLACRATAGDNAPDLGVRVDSASGLAGACVSSGVMQQCRDTETDPRVNAEACRRLGVRSMLIAPLVDAQKLIGIIQVFSAWPNAFGEREISALQVLAERIAESHREAAAGIPVEEPQAEPLPVPDPLPEQISTEPIPAGEPEGFSPPEGERKGFDFWGTVLVVLVIAAAVLLGIVIGWRRAAITNRPGQIAAAGGAVSSGAQKLQAPSPEDPVQATSAPESAGVSNSKPASPPAATPPSGGLIVTENGRVVYRSPAEGRGTSAPARGQRSLIHRVEPEYPAEARERHMQGSVVLDVQVLGTGAVGNVAVVSGDPVLARSAVDAVKQWRYQPGSLKGQAVESQTRITVKFTLPAP